METTFRENLFLKIKLNQTDKLLVGLVYRSPSNRTSEYSDKLCSLISEATNKGYSHILIIGDFNYRISTGRTGIPKGIAQIIMNTNVLKQYRTTFYINIRGNQQDGLAQIPLIY